MENFNKNNGGFNKFGNPNKSAAQAIAANNAAETVTETVVEKTSKTLGEKVFGGVKNAVNKSPMWVKVTAAVAIGVIAIVGVDKMTGSHGKKWVMDRVNKQKNTKSKENDDFETTE